MKDFEGIVEIAGRPKPFGRAFRANIKLENGVWLSVIGSTAEEVARKLDGIKKGARIKATCEVRYWGRDNKKIDYIVKEIAVQADVRSIAKKLFDEKTELSKEEISALKEYLRTLIAELPPVDLQKCLEQCSTKQHLCSFLKLLQLGAEDF